MPKNWKGKKKGFSVDEQLSKYISENRRTTHDEDSETNEDFGRELEKEESSEETAEETPESEEPEMLEEDKPVIDDDEWEILEPKSKTAAPKPVKGKDEGKKRYTDKELEHLPKLSDAGKESKEEKAEKKTGEKKTEPATKFEIGIVLFSYLLRGFAIAFMSAVVYFIISRNFFGIPRGTSFISFSLKMPLFLCLLAVFLAITGFQAIYYGYYKLAHKAWKKYEPNEMVKSYGITLLGILFAIFTLWMLGMI